jgi:hypothetical protein
MKLAEIHFTRSNAAVSNFFRALKTQHWGAVGVESAELLDIGIEQDLAKELEPYKPFLVKQLLTDIDQDRHFRVRAVLAVLRHFNVTWPELAII